MKFNIDENLVFVIILDISGIYAQIYDQGYHNKEDVKDIQQQYSDTKHWRVLVLDLYIHTIYLQ